MYDNKTFREECNKVLKRTARREYKIQLRQLLIRVSISLRTNPHNTFKGTAKEYIIKHRLHKVLRERLYDHYKV